MRLSGWHCRAILLRRIHFQWLESFAGTVPSVSFLALTRTSSALMSPEQRRIGCLKGQVDVHVTTSKGGPALDACG